MKKNLSQNIVVCWTLLILVAVFFTNTYSYAASVKEFNLAVPKGGNKGVIYSIAGEEKSKVIASDGTIYVFPDEFEGVVFGTSGHRGERDKQVTVGVAAVIAQSIADTYINSNKEFKEKKKYVIIGGDPRPKNNKYQDEISRVLLANNIGVLRFPNVMPTPIGGFAVRNWQELFKNQLSENGIIVGCINTTPSHNPYKDDGIKFNPGGKYEGAPSPTEVTQPVQSRANEIIKKGGGIRRLTDNIKLDSLLLEDYIIINEKQVSDAYLKQAERFIDIDLIRKAIKLGKENNNLFKVLFNAQNGAAGYWAEQLFIAIDPDFCTILNKEPLSNFGGLKEGPNTEKWEQLKPMKEKVKNENYKVGNATDGDGDRFYFCTEKGVDINFNVVLALLFDYIRNVRKIDGVFVTCVDGFSMFEKIGPVLKRTKIGTKNFQDYLRDPNLQVALAGEGGSGGGTLGSALDRDGKGHQLDKDGMYIALLFDEMVADAFIKGKTVTDLIEDLYKKYGYYYPAKTESIALPVSGKEGLKIGNKMLDLLEKAVVDGLKIADFKITKVDKTDGLKLFLEDGHSVLIRLSGTGGGVRAYGESYSANNLLEAEKIWEYIREDRNRIIDKYIKDAVNALNEEKSKEEEKIRRKQYIKDIMDIWDKQTGYWSDRSNPDSVGNWLGWLTLPFEMEEAAKTAEAFADQKIAEGITDIVVIGMGGSSLCSLPIMSYYGREDARVNLHIVDLVHPKTIKSVLEKIDIEKTLFISITKSVTTAETLSLSKFYYSVADKDQNIKDAKKHFVMITDPNKDAKLTDLKKHFDYGKWFEIKADAGGRYSVLTNVGILPAAFIKKDAAVDMVKGAKKAADRCKSDNPKVNDALRISLDFYKNFEAGRKKVVLVLPEELKPYGFWFEQLMYESLGKDNIGLIPIFDEELVDPKYYKDDLQFFYVKLEGSEDINAAKMNKIKKAGLPVVDFKVLKDEGLGGLFYTSEFAIAAAGRLMGINPFDQPGVQLSKTKTYEYLKKTLKEINKVSDYSIEEDGIVFDYASMYGKNKLKELDRVDALEYVNKLKIAKGKSLIARYYAAFMYESIKMKGKGYAPLLPYVYESEELSTLWKGWRKRMRIVAKVSTMLGIGPRFQHSTGHGILQGEGDSFITFVRQLEYKNDFRVPGTSYTFGKLINAQQKANEDTFAKSGKFAVRFDVKNFNAENVKKLNKIFKESFEILNQMLDKEDLGALDIRPGKISGKAVSVSA